MFYKRQRSIIFSEREHTLDLTEFIFINLKKEEEEKLNSISGFIIKSVLANERARSGGRTLAKKLNYSIYLRIASFILQFVGPKKKREKKAQRIVRQNFEPSMNLVSCVFV